MIRWTTVEELKIEKELILEKIFTDMVKNPKDWKCKLDRYGEPPILSKGGVVVDLIGNTLNINNKFFGNIKGAEKIKPLFSILKKEAELDKLKLDLDNINESIEGWSK